MDETTSDIAQVGDGGNGTVIDPEESNQGSEGEVSDTDFDVTPLIQQLMQHDGNKADDELLNVVADIRETFDSESKPDSDACDTKNVQTILKTEGCVAKFVQLLDRHDHWSLQMDSVMIMANIVYEGIEQSKAVVEAGALPRIISLLESPVSEVRLSAAWTLKNISYHPENRAARTRMLDLGVIPKLLPLLEGTVVHVVNVVMALRHLCRVEYSPTPFKQLAPCLGPLALLTTHDVKKVRDNACWTLADVALVHGSPVLTVLTPMFVQALEKRPPGECLRIQSPSMKLALILRSVMAATNPTSDQECTSQEEHQDETSGKLSKRTPKRSADRVKSGRVSTRSTTKRTIKARRARPSRLSKPRTCRKF